MTTLTIPNRLMQPVSTRPARRAMALGFVAKLFVASALVDRLMEDLPLEMGHHWVIAI